MIKFNKILLVLICLCLCGCNNQEEPENFKGTSYKKLKNIDVSQLESSVYNKKDLKFKLSNKFNYNEGIYIYENNDKNYQCQFILNAIYEPNLNIEKEINNIVVGNYQRENININNINWEHLYYENASNVNTHAFITSYKDIKYLFYYIFSSNHEYEGKKDECEIYLSDIIKSLEFD